MSENMLTEFASDCVEKYDHAVAYWHFCLFAACLYNTMRYGGRYGVHGPRFVSTSEQEFIEYVVQVFNDESGGDVEAQALASRIMHSQEEFDARVADRLRGEMELEMIRILTDIGASASASAH
jgi:hypothetical protein